MHKRLVIDAWGPEEDDVEDAFTRAIERMQEGNTSGGHNGNEIGFWFELDDRPDVEEGDLAFTIEVHVQSEALREEYEQMESPKPSFEDYRAEQASLAGDSVRAWWTDERVSVTIR